MLKVSQRIVKAAGFLVLGSVALVSGMNEAQAQVQGDWLGAARSALHCSRIAASAGYTAHYFGIVNYGGFLYNNGCLGLNRLGGGEVPGGRTEYYAVYPYENEDARDCRRDIHDALRSVSCDVDNGTEVRLICESTGGGAVKAQLRNVRCVREVAGPFSRRPGR